MMVELNCIKNNEKNMTKYSVSELVNRTDVLILPWNIADELSENIKKLAPDANIWVAQPSMKKLN